jgi:general secretion pathway protein E
VSGDRTRIDGADPSATSSELARTPDRREVGVDPARASREFLEKVPRDFARAHTLLSQGSSDDTTSVERLAVAATTPAGAIFNVGVRLERRVEAEILDAEAIVRAIDVAYARRPSQSDSWATRASVDEMGFAMPSLDDLLLEADQDLLRTQGKSRVVQLVDALLFDAVGRNASDIHVQPTDDETLVRYRVDGALATIRTIPKSLTAAVLGRIKVMGRLDVAERRLPQDGRATVTIGSGKSDATRSIDLRIGIFPTSYGERAVLRILDSSRRLTDLEGLGMPSVMLGPFLQAANRADGLVLVTGPTGSGKTTTLYSTLSRIASPDLNVMTIEDPIEYDLASAGLSVSQSQVNTKKGVTFASGLRHLLRQDPDVILVGEIRDAETARMAIQSSLTGHLVFATLHTNDAPSAVTRLVDLGVEPFLVSASLAAVLAQRLLRQVHVACGGAGCSDCLSTGFLGRIGAFELMEIDEELRSLIARNAPLGELRSIARAKGMKTLREEGVRMVREGVTTQVELERVIQGGES